MDRNFHPLVNCILTGIICTLSACAVSTRVDYQNEEGSLGSDFFIELRDNKTDTDWLLANLGEPFHSELHDNTVHVFSWQISREEYKHASFLLMFRYNTVEKEKQYLHVIAKDGVVKKHWLDSSPRVQARYVERVN
jgi:hypothetical protein